MTAIAATAAQADVDWVDASHEMCEVEKRSEKPIVDECILHKKGRCTFNPTYIWTPNQLEMCSQDCWTDQSSD